MSFPSFLPSNLDRPYQDRVIRSCLDGFRNGFISLLMKSAVGSGKTYMSLRVADHFARQGWRVGWAAHRRNLLAQAQREHQHFGFQFPLLPISMFDSNPPPVDFLVVDESHHDATASMAHIHSISKPKLVLGPSATPIRTDKAGLCFQTTIEGAGIQELIDAGYLSQYYHFTIDDWEPDTVCRHYLMEPERWGQSIMFFLTLAQCLKARNILAAAGVRCEVVHGGSDREDQLQRFEAREVDVLISMSILTEGFNCPQLQTVFVRDSVESPTIQMAGRVLRQYPELEFKNIVQSENSSWPMPRTARSVCSYKWVNGSWLATQVHPELEQIILDNRRKMIEHTVTEARKLVGPNGNINTYREKNFPAAGRAASDPLELFNRKPKRRSSTWSAERQEWANQRRRDMKGE